MLNNQFTKSGTRVWHDLRNKRKPPQYKKRRQSERLKLQQQQKQETGGGNGSAKPNSASKGRRQYPLPMKRKRASNANEEASNPSKKKPKVTAGKENLSTKRRSQNIDKCNLSSAKKARHSDQDTKTAKNMPTITSRESDPKNALKPTPTYPPVSQKNKVAKKKASRDEKEKAQEVTKKKEEGCDSVGKIQIPATSRDDDPKTGSKPPSYSQTTAKVASKKKIKVRTVENSDDESTTTEEDDGPLNLLYSLLGKKPHAEKKTQKEKDTKSTATTEKNDDPLGLLSPLQGKKLPKEADTGIDLSDGLITQEPTDDVDLDFGLQDDEDEDFGANKDDIIIVDAYLDTDEQDDAKLPAKKTQKEKDTVVDADEDEYLDADEDEDEIDKNIPTGPDDPTSLFYKLSQQGSREEKLEAILSLKYSDLRALVKRALPNDTFSNRKKKTYQCALYDHFRLAYPTKEEEKNRSKKSNQNRRSIFSRPVTCSQVKCNASSRKFTICAENIDEFQYCSTFPERIRDGKPQMQTMMVVFDEMIEQPSMIKGKANKDIKNYFRQDEEGNEKPKMYFLVPENFNKERIGKVFEQVGKDMQLSSTQYGDGWAFTENVGRFFKYVYGNTSFKSQGINKQKKNRRK